MTQPTATPTATPPATPPAAQPIKPADKPALVTPNEGSTVSNDFFLNPDVKALVALPTAVDHLGIERITGIRADGWELPPSELTTEEIKAAEEREVMFERAKKTRLAGGVSSLNSDTSGAANASPGVGGSGSA